MDRFPAKSLVLFLLLASLSGAHFLSPEQEVSSEPGVTAGAISFGAGVRFGQDLPGHSELQQYTAAGHVLGFREDGVVIASGSHALRVGFVNARMVSPVEEGISSRPSQGQGLAPRLGKVTYRDLWDGISILYEKAESGVIKSTYYIQPGEAKALNPVDEIRLRYNVPVRIDFSGNLVLSFATGEMREARPVAWHNVRGLRAAVGVGFRLLSDWEVGFKVGNYDPRYLLVIDPEIRAGTSGSGGYNVVWYMSGASWIGSAELISVGDASWQIMGTGDYNNDGSIDILWRYNGAGGYNVIWYMNGVSWVESVEIFPVVDLSWKIVSR